MLASPARWLGSYQPCFRLIGAAPEEFRWADTKPFRAKLYPRRASSSRLPRHLANQAEVIFPSALFRESPPGCQRGQRQRPDPWPHRLSLAQPGRCRRRRASARECPGLSRPGWPGYLREILRQASRRIAGRRWQICRRAGHWLVILCHVSPLDYRWTCVLALLSTRTPPGTWRLPSEPMSNQAAPRPGAGTEPAAAGWRTAAGPRRLAGSTARCYRGGIYEARPTGPAGYRARLGYLIKLIWPFVSRMAQRISSTDAMSLSRACSARSSSVSRSRSILRLIS